MRRSMTTLFFLLLGTLLVRHVRAAVPDGEGPHPAAPKQPDPLDSPSPGFPNGNPDATPTPPPAPDNEGEENIDYSAY